MTIKYLDSKRVSGLATDRTTVPNSNRGTVTTDGSYTVIKFNSDGTFTPTSAFDVEYLVIAGGGAGGFSIGGGGGAGGYRTATGHGVTGKNYGITVGAGGARTTVNGDAGDNGSDSVFDTITSTGGGGGSSADDATGAGHGGSGGGGSGYANVTKGNGNTPSTSPSQGYDGGTGVASTTTGCGGGGGSSAVGGSGSGGTSGNGGAGTSSSITGSAVTRAGGGGSSHWNGTIGTGGSGGGTDGARGTGGTSNAGDNTGSGGGGFTQVGGGAAGAGAGGSGVVIVRFLTSGNTYETGTPTVAIPTDIQDNSIFVETDTARRYWFEKNTSILDEDFSSYATQGAADAVWSNNGNTSVGQVNISTDVLDATGNTSTVCGVIKDLGAVDSTFILKFKLNITTATQYTSGSASPKVKIGLFSTDEDGRSTQEIIALDVNAFDNAYRFLTNGSTTPDAGGSTGMGNYGVETRWIKITRDGGDVTGTVYTANTYASNVLEATSTQSVSGTITSALRYIGVKGGNTGSGNGTVVLSIDDVEFWNGNTSSTPTWTWDFYNDMKAYWKMNESSGNLLNTATSAGSTTTMSADLVSSGTVNRGRTGHISGVDCIGFPTYDADGNKVTANNSASDYGFMNKAGAKFTACWWARNYSYNSTVDLWGLGGNGNAADINVRQRGQSGFTVWFSGTEYTGFSTDVSSNGWYFYMLSWDEDGGSNNAQLQINGTKQTATVTTTNTADSNSPLTIGDVSGNEPQMDIQEFSLWNRVLTDAEIAYIYNSGTGREL